MAVTCLAMSNDVQERRQQMFPKLTDAQIARIAAHAVRRSIPAGQVVFNQGDTDLGIQVVLSGALEVVRPGIAGDDLITVHGPGQFTGEVSTLSGRRALVRGRMREAGVSVVYQHPALAPDLTVLENLQLAASSLAGPGGVAS